MCLCILILPCCRLQAAVAVDRSMNPAGAGSNVATLRMVNDDHDGALTFPGASTGHASVPPALPSPSGISHLENLFGRAGLAVNLRPPPLGGPASSAIASMALNSYHQHHPHPADGTSPGGSSLIDAHHHTVSPASHSLLHGPADSLLGLSTPYGAGHLLPDSHGALYTRSPSQPTVK